MSRFPFTLHWHPSRGFFLFPAGGWGGNLFLVWSPLRHWSGQALNLAFPNNWYSYSLLKVDLQTLTVFTGRSGDWVTVFSVVFSCNKWVSSINVFFLLSFSFPNALAEKAGLCWGYFWLLLVFLDFWTLQLYVCDNEAKGNQGTQHYVTHHCSTPKTPTSLSFFSIESLYVCFVHTIQGF